MKKKIVNSGPVKRKIDPDFITQALGAENTGIKIDVKQGPIALLALTKILSKELKSTGGRPRLIGTERERKKVPFYKDDWAKLEELAHYIKEQIGYSVSAAQLASIMIHTKLTEILTKEIKY